MQYMFVMCNDWDSLKPVQSRPENSTSPSRPDLPNHLCQAHRSQLYSSADFCLAMPGDGAVQCGAYDSYPWAYSWNASYLPSTSQPRSKVVHSYILPDFTPKYVAVAKFAARHNATPFKHFLITTDPKDKPQYCWGSQYFLLLGSSQLDRESISSQTIKSPVAIATVMPNHTSLIEHLFDLLLDMYRYVGWQLCATIHWSMQSFGPLGDDHWWFPAGNSNSQTHQMVSIHFCASPMRLALMAAMGQGLALEWMSFW